MAILIGALVMMESLLRQLRVRRLCVGIFQRVVGGCDSNIGDINVEFTIYGNDKTGISIEFDPIIKKDIRLEFRWELGAVDVNYDCDDYSGYDDAVVGFADVFDSFAPA